MDFNEIVEAMSLHYDNDVDYQNIAIDNGDGSFRLDYRVTFELLNDIPDDPIAPFFPVASLEEAKAVFRAVEPKMRKEEIDGFFDQVLITLPVVLNMPLYFTMYKIPRSA
ncbi:hypothetical protein [Polluticoccus soli]|uniref:hypothetical protein n=1 Tax=Polluticoccus soli TaxID=3034150 RepID=UPI0023E2DE9B|nr:hypothetical protein [Flavipsychrobacter sp. JY13-12]